jgi:dTDP-4-dehydrorhamnose 3,5-epimerase
LRRSSPTFGRAFGALLDDKKRRMLWVPPGFAHGFLVVSEEAEFVYKCTEYYAPEDEHCLRWDDNKAAVDWPKSTQELIISVKDRQGLNFDDCPKYA